MPGSSGAAPFPPAGPPTEEELELGYVSGVFGVQGEVRLHLHHRESELLADGHDVVLVSEGKRFAAHLKARPGAGKRVLGRFRQRITREQAADLKGTTIHVPISALPALEEGEYWVWELRGAPVRVAGEVVGKVVEVHATGPVDVFEVKLEGSSEHVFVPSVKEQVVSASARGLELREHPG